MPPSAIPHEDRRRYLGPYDDPESRERHHRFIAECEVENR